MSSRADWVSYHYYVGLLKISEDKVNGRNGFVCRSIDRSFYVYHRLRYRSIQFRASSHLISSIVSDDLRLFVRSISTVIAVRFEARTASPSLVLSLSHIFPGRLLHHV